MLHGYTWLLLLSVYVVMKMTGRGLCLALRITRALRMVPLLWGHSTFLSAAGGVLRRWAWAMITRACERRTWLRRRGRRLQPAETLLLIC